MGGVVDAIFGSGGSDVSGTDPKENIRLFGNAQDQILGGVDQFSTGFSSLDPRSGVINIDPTGRNLNLTSLGIFGQNLGQTRESLLGNQGAFMNARVNPLIEQLAAGRGQLERSINRTGVRGTLQNQALQNYDIAGNRAVADQRALATNDSLNALTTLDQLLFQGGTGVGQNITDQELATLGLSVDTVKVLKAIASNLATGAASTAADASAYAGKLDAARSGNILGTLGLGLLGFGGLGDAAAAGGTGHGVRSLFGAATV